jgi:hypothetical protein
VRMATKAGRIVGLVLVAALGTAACGSGGASTSNPASAKRAPAALHAVEAAYTTTVGDKTARFALTETLKAHSTAGSSQSQTVTGSGQADFATHAFEVSVNAPAGGSVQVLEVAGVAYTQMPPASRAQVPGHKQWVAVNLNQVDQAKLGQSFSQLASAANDSPTQVLTDLGSVSSTVTKVGTATVGGVSTVEYHAVVDLNKVAARAKAKAGAKAAQAVVAEEQALGTHSLPVEVWVDANHLVRQVREQVPIPAASAGATNGSGSATMTMTFSAYGSPVTLSPPPASQVANITAQVLQQANTNPETTTTTAPAG